MLFSAVAQRWSYFHVCVANAVLCLLSSSVTLFASKPDEPQELPRSEPEADHEAARGASRFPVGVGRAKGREGRSLSRWVSGVRKG